MGTRDVGSGRVIAGQPDAINRPNSGTVPGKPPFIWITGGDRSPVDDPAVLGLDRLLDAWTDVGGYTILQVNAPIGDDWGPVVAMGSDAAVARVNTGVAYHRANLQGTNDPPIVFGVSNGAITMSIYMLTNPITAFIGFLPVTGIKAVYDSDFHEENNPQSRPNGFRDDIEDSWSVTYPTYPPARFSPYDNRAAYDVAVLRKRVQIWYTANDYIYVAEEMGFYSHIGAEQHNVGGYGHLGLLNDPTLMADGVDVVRLVEFTNEAVALG